MIYLQAVTTLAQHGILIKLYLKIYLKTNHNIMRGKLGEVVLISRSENNHFGSQHLSLRNMHTLTLNIKSDKYNTRDLEKRIIYNSFNTN